MKNFFALLTTFALVFSACGNGSETDNENNNNGKTTLTITNLATSLSNFEITYGNIVFRFSNTDKITQEVDAGDNYLYINDLVLTDYMKSLKVKGEAVYKTSLLTCEKGKNNQFVIMDNTVVTLLGNFTSSGEATDTIKNVQGIIFEYTGKEARGFNKIQTWFYDLIEDFNNAPDGTTHTITLTESFEFPAGGKYRNSSGWRTPFKEGQNKKIIIKGDSSVRTITNNGKQFDGYYQLEANGYLFLVTNGITLELGNNIILNGNGSDLPVIYVEEGGAFIMNNGSTITGNFDSAVSSYGTFTMNGGTINGNKANTMYLLNAGGVNIYGGTFTMNDGIIRNNIANTTGGGVFIDGGTFIMNGGTISGNKAIGTFSNGGGVFLTINGSFIKTGGTIDDTNEADIGKVAYAAATNGNKYRETTAGPTDNMDSTKEGSAGGWE